MQSIRGVPTSLFGNWSQRQIKIKNNKYTVPFRSPMKKVQAVAESGVVMDYVTTYGQYICAGPDPFECIRNMILPPPEEQQKIVLRLFEISQQVDMQGLNGVFMKLLITHDDSAVDTLLEMLKMHNMSTDVINSIIRYSREIPLPNGTDSLLI
jgi:hypothetical protein